ncbi:UNVERIFIED_ORG: hypothetical protein M2435_003524 [Rhizobium sophorae]|nr:hypothetical protein [Rhizobium leguminosarum]MDH6660610.1 hypothetical protein [Rhizobium sophorae]TBZ36773.1 hypothetical protein E0H44_29365 [Rhizobium leguminosarum bv. viciae]TCA02226.1 hypothetical protein E0H68_36200 [Rhizobium leguminosarum bv. viciae]TCA16584.1 hypothetical protein E0H67_32110 [Rhizobium leguminosarum bv. viciae]
MSVDHCHDFVVRGDDRSALSGKEIRRSGSATRAHPEEQSRSCRHAGVAIFAKIAATALRQPFMGQTQRAEWSFQWTTGSSQNEVSCSTNVRGHISI